MFGRGLYYGERCFGGFGVSRFFNSPLHFIIPLIFIIIISYLIFRVVKSTRPAIDHSLEMLKLKYISGEINEEEYIRKREILTK